MKIASVALAALMFSAIAARGAPTSLNDMAAPSDYKKLKPGLWETTLRTEITAPPIDMSAMIGTLDPAARARVEAVLKRQAAERAARNGVPDVTSKTKQECLTQEVIDKRSLSINSDRRDNNLLQNCPPVLKSRTSSRLVVSSECTVAADKGGRGGKFTSEMTFEIKSPEETYTSITSSGNFGGQASKTARSASSRWLGSACGNVKFAN